MHHSSSVQQMVAAAALPGWTINSMRPPPPPPLPPHHPSLLVAPPSSSTWNIDPPASLCCCQLLLEGVVGAEDNTPTGFRPLENWEQQLLNLPSNSATTDYGNPEFHTTPSNTFNWPYQMPCASTSSSLPSSCVNALISNMVNFSANSSDLQHPHQGQGPSPECNSNGTKIGGAAKKARLQPPSPQSTFKVRKEKLGDKITALHQLVSPFGKTDTSSVLLEGIGYIRFLQSQIEALSLPYLAAKSTSHTGSNEELQNNLRSRGLCLVPISCTLQVESDNGADYWAPAFDTNFR